MKLHVSIIILFVFVSLNISAQNNCGWSTINDADQKYKTGNFEEAIKTVETCIINFDEEQKVQAYRLIAKSELEQDNDSAANMAVMKLLNINSNYQPDYLSDPPKFVKIISLVKAKMNELIVTSVSKKAENIYEAPATVISISEKQIKNRGYLDYEAMLHDLPGFDISRSNGNIYSHIYQRGYRSINTNRTLFLIDGIEENDLWSSNVYLSRQYSMSNVKNVEVIYGPASTMYGSNAFLGVVNIITKEPQDLIATGKQIGFNASAGYGTYNTKFFDATLAAKTKSSNIAFSATARMFNSDEQDLSKEEGYSFAPRELTDELSQKYHSALDITDSNEITEFLANNPDNSNLYTLENGQIILTEEGVKQALAYDNDVYNKVKFSDKTEAISLSAKLKIYDFLIGWSYWNKAEGPGAQYNDIMFMGFNQGQSWRPVHQYFYIKYEKDINSKLNISNFLRYKVHDFDKDNGIVRYRKYYSNGKYDLENLINNKVPQWDSLYLFQKSNQVRNELKAVYSPFPKLDIVAGFEARFSSIQGDYTMSKHNDAEERGIPLTEINGGNHFYSRDLGLYAQAAYTPINKLKITLGLRFDNNKIRETEGYGSVFNPRVAIVYTPSDFVIKAIYATAFKDANNREKYSTAAGKRELSNAELEPEEVQNYEFVLGKNFNKKVNLSIATYYSSYSNIIQEVSVKREDGSYTNQNQAFGQALIYGINAFADYKVKNFTSYANYTYTEPYNINPKDSEGNPLQDADGNIYTKLRIGDIANHQVNIGVNYFFKEMINFNLRTNIVGKRLTGEGTTVSTNPETFNPYAVLNGSIRYTHKKSHLTLQLSVFNILNTKYYSQGLDQASGVLASKLIQNGRNLHLSINYNF